MKLKNGTNPFVKRLIVEIQQGSANMFNNDMAATCPKVFWEGPPLTSRKRLKS